MQSIFMVSIGMHKNCYGFSFFDKDLDITIIYPKGEEILIRELNHIRLLPFEVPPNKHFRKDVVQVCKK